MCLGTIKVGYIQTAIGQEQLIMSTSEEKCSTVTTITEMIVMWIRELYGCPYGKCEMPSVDNTEPEYVMRIGHRESRP